MQDRATNRAPGTSDQCVECGIPKSQTRDNKLTRGRCRNCYQRHVYALKKNEAFEAIRAQPLADRFLERVRPEANGCHRWTGAIGGVGYGTLTVDGRTEYAHRVAYTLFVGQIPEGMHIDHACHNRDESCLGEERCLHRRCVNPEHLEPVTVQRNILRSPLSVAGRNARKTHCKHGHAFTTENTIVKTTGRECRACHNAAQSESAKRRRTARRAA